MKKAIMVILILFFALALGFAMEWIKVEINWILDLMGRIPSYEGLTLESKKNFVSELPQSEVYSYYDSHEHMWILHKLNASSLFLLKWFLAFLFCLLFYCLGLALIRALELENKRLYRIIYVYAFSLSLLVFISGKLSGFDLYPFSRKILGFLQSIIPAGLIILLSKANIKK